MKKYISAILINVLPFKLQVVPVCKKQLNMNLFKHQIIQKLYVKTEDKEYTFEEGNYIFTNDTIYGKGEFKLLLNPYVPFEGKISYQ